MPTVRRLALAAGTLTVLAAVGSIPANAATAHAPNPAGLGVTAQTLTCGDAEVTILSPQTPDDVQSWSVGRITVGGSGHLIPVTFTFAITTVDGDGNTVTLFSDTAEKGNGQGNRNQDTILCEQSMTDGTVSEVFADAPPEVLADPEVVELLELYGEQLATMTFSVTAVPKS